MAGSHAVTVQHYPRTARKLFAALQAQPETTFSWGKGVMSSVKQNPEDPTAPTQIDTPGEQTASLDASHEWVHVKETSYPFSVVGQLSNGCTAFLIGPCHVMTAAHCVYDPHHKIWWPGLEFHAGRNAQNESPHGEATWQATHVPEEWKQTGHVQHDYAIIILKQSLGKQLGWLQPTESFAWTQQYPGGMTEAQKELRFNMAGYPDNKPNGTMWYTTCTGFKYKGKRTLSAHEMANQANYGHSTNRRVTIASTVTSADLIVHNCATRGGTSGSPLWVYDSENPQRVDVVAMHVAAESMKNAVGRETSSLPLAVPFDGMRGPWIKHVIATTPSCL